MVEEQENVYVFGDKEGIFNPQKVAGGRPHVRKQTLHNIDNIYNQKNFKPSPNPDGNMFPCSVIEHENVYVFGEKEGTYNPHTVKGKPYKYKQGTPTNTYGKEGQGGVITENDGDRFPTSVIEHENVYIFGEKEGTYNPQKTEGKPIDDLSNKLKENFMEYDDKSITEDILNGDYGMASLKSFSGIGTALPSIILY